MRYASPVSLRYSSTGPMVQHTPFLKFHTAVVPQLIGRQPSAFERATAHALWQAFARMPTEGTPKAFTAVSAATGSGKSVGACTLIAYLVTQGQTCAYVVETIEAVEEVRALLDKVLPGKVAAYSSIHRANAAPDKVRDYSDMGVTALKRFTEEEFLNAPVVVTTHDRWRREITEGKSLGVLTCGTEPRALVVVDEEPETQVVYQRQPEDVSALASVLADNSRKGDARELGFTSDHFASDTLLAIHDRMRRLKDNASIPQMYSADIVTAEDADVLESITRQDLSIRLSGTLERLEFHWETVEFLRAAAQGRVFYARGTGSSFYAYAFRLAVKPRHVILDGTADLNAMYAVGSHVLTIEAERADYSQVKLVAVRPPQEFVGRMRDDGIMRDYRGASKYMEWFIDYLVKNTVEGEQVLVYGKKRLLSFGAHKLPQYDTSGSNELGLSHYRGRVIHWVNFGRGRGLNKWKDCTSYFRLGDFHMRRAVATATVGSLTGRTFGEGELKKLSSPKHRHPEVTEVMETHRVVFNKQDAARICIRSLNDEGVASAATLHMIDCDLGLLVKYKDRMFPCAPEYSLIGYEAAAGKGGAERLANLLLTTDAARLSMDETALHADVRKADLPRTLRVPVVVSALAARGWTETTLKALGLPGKGKVFTR